MPSAPVPPPDELHQLALRELRQLSTSVPEASSSQATGPLSSAAPPTDVIEHFRQGVLLLDTGAPSHHQALTTLETLHGALKGRLLAILGTSSILPDVDYNDPRVIELLAGVIQDPTVRKFLEQGITKQREAKEKQVTQALDLHEHLEEQKRLKPTEPALDSDPKTRMAKLLAEQARTILPLLVLQDTATRAAESVSPAHEEPQISPLKRVDPIHPYKGRKP